MNASIPLRPDQITLTIHRSAHQIGGNCIELVCDGHRLLLDAGQPLDAVEGDTPVFPATLDRSLPATVLISHPHADHYGLLRWLPPGWQVWTGEASAELIRLAAGVGRWQAPAMQTWRHHRPFQVGPFRVTPLLTDHSAFDAHMLLIEAAGRRLLYTGDFRIHGRKTGVVERLMAHPPEHLDALVMEGTTLGRGGEIRSEDDIEAQFTDLFKRTAGRVFVAWAGSQVDRTVTLVRACMRAKRPLVIDIYTADILRRLLRWSPRLPQPGQWPVRTVITSRLASSYRRRGWGQTVDDLARDRLSVRRLRHESRAVIMVRESLLPDYTRGGLVPTADDAWSWSQWRGYLQTPKGRIVEDWFAQRGCPHEHLHTSGHARPDDLRTFANAMRPGVLIPVHGEHWDEIHAGFPMIKRLGDGKSWSLGSV